MVKPISMTIKGVPFIEIVEQLLKHELTADLRLGLYWACLHPICYNRTYNFLFPHCSNHNFGISETVSML